jgi:hypothetical protein
VRWAAAFAALLACVVCCGVASADGDPASDVLIVATRFEPYTAKIPPDSRKQLAATIAAVRAKRYPVRVAMIGDQYDLGSAGLLMNRPQEYARFLATELAQFNRDWVLVVMPKGYGIYRCVAVPHPGGADECGKSVPNAADIKALKGLGAPRGDLALSADRAIRALAELHGAGLGGTPWALIGGLAAVVVILGAGGVFVLRRRRARV